MSWLERLIRGVERRRIRREIHDELRGEMMARVQELTKRDRCRAQAAMDEMLESRRLLWAAAATASPSPLRVAEIARANWTTHDRVRTATDPATGDLLITAEGR